jgi:hypothetical protein
MKYHTNLEKEITQLTGNPMGSFAISWLNLAGIIKPRGIIANTKEQDFSKAGFRRKHGRLWVSTKEGEALFKKWENNASSIQSHWGKTIGKWLWRKITGA